MLKQLHHRYLVWKMLHKKRSLFGNEIQRIIAQDNYSTSTQPTTIAVIVIMHNNVDIIEQCLDSLKKFNDYNYEIIVVDNQSTDGSADKISGCKRITNPVNGCASGRNLGAKVADAEYLMFIDSDQGPTAHHWLNTYISILQNHTEIGAVGYNGGFLTESDLTGPTLNLFSPLKQAYRTNVDYLESGGLMISKKLFEEIGGFDEQYDPHAFEDADLSRKILIAGKKIAYCPHLPIYHHAHSTTKSHEGSQEYLKQFARNAEYFRRKWLQ